MRVIGIDPAPGSDSTVFFNGTRETFAADQMSDFLTNQRTESNDLLICWDAPLTGPAEPDGDVFKKSDHTQRKIEMFFMREAGEKVPAGISVRPYSGCSHWTITQRLLGLPRTGPFMQHWSELPFNLVHDTPTPGQPRPCITEVHPAIALWLWCREDVNSSKYSNCWHYKKDTQMRQRLWESLKDNLEQPSIAVYFSALERDCSGVPDDDSIDAFVAWALGKLWIEEDSKVICLGNRQDGSFLLPFVDGLEESYTTFASP